MFGPSFHCLSITRNFNDRKMSLLLDSYNYIYQDKNSIIMLSLNEFPSEFLELMSHYAQAKRRLDRVSTDSIGFHRIITEFLFSKRNIFPDFFFPAPYNRAGPCFPGFSRVFIGF